MKISRYKYFRGTPFYISTEMIDNGEEFMQSTKVSILRHTDEGYILIGEYIRNYNSHSIETFYPFEVGTEWYALYSANYKDVRVMKLYDDRIEDWCESANDFDNYTPLEIYIPRYNNYLGYIKTESMYTTPEEFIASQETDNFLEMEYCEFGFVSGRTPCGTGIELKYIDLSNIVNKELSITDKFGSYQISKESKLIECIDMSDWTPDHNWIGITRKEYLNVNTWEKC